MIPQRIKQRTLFFSLPQDIAEIIKEREATNNICIYLASICMYLVEENSERAPPKVLTETPAFEIEKNIRGVGHSLILSTAAAVLTIHRFA